MSEVFETKVPLPAETDLTREGNTMLALARTIVIADQTMYEVAVDELRAIKAKITSREEQRRSLVDPLNAVVKRINALFKPGTEAMEQGEAVIKGAMLAYDAKVRAEAAAERRRLEAIAAEEQRQIEERRRAEEARLIAERDAANQRVAQAATLDEQAAASMELAKTQVAIDRVNIEASTATLATVAASHVEVTTPKAKGASTATGFDYEVLNWDRWVEHCVGKDLHGLVIEDSVKMRAHVKANGLKAAVPNVLAVWEKGTVRIRK